MSNLLERIRTLLTALPTWLTAAAALVAIFSEEITDLLPDDWQGGFAQAVVTVLAVLTAAVNIVRRVTPVIGAQHGLLPVEGQVVPTQNAPAA